MSKTAVSEKTIHDVMRETAQKLWDEFGIRVDDVSFSWVDLSTLDELSFEATDVSIRTYTKGCR